MEHYAMPMTDRDWEAEADADALARASEIMADTGRMNAAKTAAKKRADHLKVEAEAMQKAADNLGKPVSAGGSVPPALKEDGWKYHGEE